MPRRFPTSRLILLIHYSDSLFFLGFFKRGPRRFLFLERNGVPTVNADVDLLILDLDYLRTSIVTALASASAGLRAMAKRKRKMTISHYDSDYDFSFSL